MSPTEAAVGPERATDRRGSPATAAASTAWPRGLEAASARLDFLAAARRDPENAGVRLRHAATPLLASVPARLPGLAALDRRARNSVFALDLRLLHDVLEGSPADGRYWVWSGLLLGWAREGRLLAHDLRDADFAYAAADEGRIRAGIEALVRAGFRRGFSLRNNRGEVTEHTVIRHGARFEFFRMSERGPDWEYFVYGGDGGHQVQLTARLPIQDLEPFDFLGRRWLKVADHQSELAELYGDWRTPATDWSFLDQGGIVGLERWPRVARRAEEGALGAPWS